jgi:glutamate dehydrogenase/leucine dehydrogenase
LTAKGIGKVATDIALAMRDFHTGNKVVGISFANVLVHNEKIDGGWVAMDGN